jgi:hypothetical protein
MAEVLLFATRGQHIASLHTLDTFWGGGVSSLSQHCLCPIFSRWDRLRLTEEYKPGRYCLVKEVTHKLYDSVCIICSKQVNSQRQGCQGLGERGWGNDYCGSGFLLEVMQMF